MTQWLDEALAWHALGYTPAPIHADGSKRPIGTWKHLQEAHPTADHVRAAFTGVDTDGIGLITGATSGNLEMFELEARAIAEGVLADLVSAFADHSLDGLWQRIDGGYVEITPTGGMHWYYRVDGDVHGNTRLARRPSTGAELANDPDNRLQVLIETRGEGGFTVVAPSAGRTHPTGMGWAAIRGSKDTIPTITADERDALHMMASLLDRMPVRDTPAAPTARPRRPGDPVRPGDDYNNRATWEDVLLPHGWKVFRTLGNGVIGWQRPGKRTPGLSATTRPDGGLYVFSTATEFDPEVPYTKFGAYAVLEHGGDHQAAAKALAADGYGEQAAISPTDPLEGLLPTTPATVGTAALKPSPVSGEPRLIDDVNTITAAYGPTEDGTARALARLHAGQLRFCPQRGSWLHWNGHRWEWDTAERHREYIRHLARSLPEDDGWKTYKKRALSASGVTGISRLAQSDPAFAVHIDDLDANPYEINTPGGVVDLRTGTIRPPDPSALHTRTTKVAPDFEAEPERWLTFLDDTFGGDAEVIAFMQRLMGVSIIGTVLEQLMPFAYGPGANGKSTFMEVSMDVMGRGEEGYAIAAPSEMLMARRFSEHPAELAQLAGARLVVCSELEDGARFAEARIKQLTGSDSINARFMRGNPFTFTPSHTIWLIGNHKPTAAVGGSAFWRRIALLSFSHVVPEDQRDRHLVSKLDKEAPSILAWIIKGAADYLSGGLRTPQRVSAATAAYRADQDTVGRFVADLCHLAPGSPDLVRTPVAQLRSAYEAWCHEAGDEPASPRRLTQELRDRYGIESKQSHGKRSYHGVSLLIPDDDEGSRWGD